MTNTATLPTQQRLERLVARMRNGAMASRAAERIYTLAQRHSVAGNIDLAEGLTCLADGLHYRKHELCYSMLGEARIAEQSRQATLRYIRRAVEFLGS